MQCSVKRALFCKEEVPVEYRKTESGKQVVIIGVVLME